MCVTHCDPCFLILSLFLSIPFLSCFLSLLSHGFQFKPNLFLKHLDAQVVTMVLSKERHSIMCKNKNKRKSLHRKNSESFHKNFSEWRRSRHWIWKVFKKRPVCWSFCSNFLWLWIGYDFSLMTMCWCCRCRGMWEAESEDLCYWHCSAWNWHLWSRCGAWSCRSRIGIVSWGQCKHFSQMRPFKHMDVVVANFFLRAHCNIIACTSYVQSKCNRCQTFTQCIWFSLVNEPHDPFPICSHFR